MTPSTPQLVGVGVAISLFALSMTLALYGRAYVGRADGSTKAHDRFMYRAYSLGWLSWSNLSLQGCIIAVGLTIATKDTALAIAVLIGLIIAILSMGYRHALRLAFFLYSRADALFILEVRGKLKDGVPLDDGEFAQLATLLSPQDGADGKGDRESAISALIDLLKK